jgi:hypothetical protein
MVTLDPIDYQVIAQASELKGLGNRGFSASLRMIVREWAAAQGLNVTVATDDQHESI